MRGSALAPHRTREALHCGSSNLCAENGIDLGAEPRFRDLGDLELTRGTIVLKQIEEAIISFIEQDVYVLSLGGDHAITYPIIKAYSQKYDNLNILHLDAHPDLYGELEGNRYSHACPFARIMEEGLAMRLVQVGIRTMNPHQLAQARRFGVEVIEMRRWNPPITFAFEGPVYLSLDIDVLDPGFAPGVSHYEPGGLSPREVIQIIQSLQVSIVGADIVEFNPKRDTSGMTAMVAAKFLKEIAGKMIERN
jgi:agmatinase